MTLEAIFDDLSVDGAWRRLRHIAEQIPSRLAGSPNARRMAEYAREGLAEAGFAAQLEELPGLVSFPGPGLVRVLEPDHREIAWTPASRRCAAAPKGAPRASGSPKC